MIVDTSALLAILRAEPDADRYADALAGSAEPLMSAATYIECAAVVDANRDPVLSGRFDDLLSVARIAIEPVTEEQAKAARHGYSNYGRGSGHRAQLNLGDCFAYALSRATGQPLLFKGDGFSQTDVARAVELGAESA